MLWVSMLLPVRHPVPQGSLTSPKERKNGTLSQAFFFDVQDSSFKLFFQLIKNNGKQTFNMKPAKYTKRSLLKDIKKSPQNLFSEFCHHFYVHSNRTSWSSPQYQGRTQNAGAHIKVCVPDPHASIRFCKRAEQAGPQSRALYCKISLSANPYSCLQKDLG